MEDDYRRGCHQTAAMIYDYVCGCKPESIKKFIGLMEDVLCEHRGGLSKSGSLGVVFEEVMERMKK